MRDSLQKWHVVKLKTLRSRLWHLHFDSTNWRRQIRFPLLPSPPSTREGKAGTHVPSTRHVPPPRHTSQKVPSSPNTFTHQPHRTPQSPAMLSRGITPVHTCPGIVSCWRDAWVSRVPGSQLTGPELMRCPVFCWESFQVYQNLTTRWRNPPFYVQGHLGSFSGGLDSMLSSWSAMDRWESLHEMLGLHACHASSLKVSGQASLHLMAFLSCDPTWDTTNHSISYCTVLYWVFNYMLVW